jgi:hypothetical protein
MIDHEDMGSNSSGNVMGSELLKKFNFILYIRAR